MNQNDFREKFHEAGDAIEPNLLVAKQIERWGEPQMGNNKGNRVTMHQAKNRKDKPKWSSPTKMIPAACAAVLLTVGGVFAFNSINAPSASAMDEIEEAIEDTAAFTSGKITLEIDYVTEWENGSILTVVRKQDSDASVSYKDNPVFENPESMEASFNHEMELVRVGEFIYVEASTDKGQWIKADNNDYDYESDNFDAIFRNSDRQFDASGAIELLKKSENLSEVKVSGSEKIYTATVDLKSVSETEAAALPSGLDAMVLDSQTEVIGKDNSAEKLADVSVHLRDGRLEKIVVSVEDAEGKAEVAITYSELGETQTIEAPSEELLLSEEEATRALMECTGVCPSLDKVWGNALGETSSRGSGSGG